MLKLNSDILCLGVVVSGCGSLLSGSYIREQLDKRNNCRYPLENIKVVSSITFWPLTLPYSLYHDNEFIDNCHYIKKTIQEVVFEKL